MVTNELTRSWLTTQFFERWSQRVQFDTEAAPVIIVIIAIIIAFGLFGATLAWGSMQTRDGPD